MELLEKNKTSLWAKLDILRLVFNPEFIKISGKSVKEDSLLELASRLYEFVTRE